MRSAQQEVRRSLPVARPLPRLQPETPRSARSSTRAPTPTQPPKQRGPASVQPPTEPSGLQVTNTTSERLALRHVHYLLARAIDPSHREVAYLFSADRQQVARLLNRSHAPAGGLVIPYPGRPDHYRVRLFDDAGQPVSGDGDVPRFLTSSGPVPAYFTLSATSTRQCVVVEDPTKAMAAAIAGFPAIGLGGSGTTLRKDKIPSPRLNESWPDVSGATFTLCFDAGRVANPAVARDEARLVQALEAGGAAEVLVAALPLNPAGGCWGPDDFLAAHGSQGRDVLRAVLKAAVPGNPLKRLSLTDADHCSALLDDLPFRISVLMSPASVQDQVREWFRSKKKAGALREALKAAESRLREQERSQADSTYSVVDGHLATIDARGASRFLANYSARIIAETASEPGLERFFLIEGSTCDGGPLPQVLVSSSEFTTNDWALAHWGVRARREPGRGIPDLIRAAIQAISFDVRTIHASVGWILKDGRHVFLHAGGAIGADGLDVFLDGALNKVRFPDDTSNAMAGVQLGLNFLSLAPLPVTVPILATAYGAVLQQFCPFHGVVHLVGPTGSRKTTLVVVAMQHFGVFDSGSLLGWASTSAAIETHLYRAKDILTVLDDFAPTSADPSDPMRRRAMEVIRSIGNGTGKQRMRSDMTQRPSQPPRGMILSTGEDLPNHESVRARTFVVPVKQGTVNLPALSALQAQVKLLPYATRAFVEWVQRNAEWLPERLEKRIVDLRTEIVQPDGHARTPEMVAHLLARFEVFTQFAQDIGALDPSHKPGWDAAAREALLAGAAEQRDGLRETNTAEVFVSTLRSLLISGEAHLAAPHVRLSEHDIGWLDQSAGVVYLEPGAAVRAVQVALQRERRALPVLGRSLWEAIAAAGYIVAHDARHHTVKRHLGQQGARPRVVALNAQALLDEQ
jgi:hypothetical protein